jgi:methylmalonyl-CoA/ethylmalonyl-CoA epimerase
MPSIKRIHHVAIAVYDFQPALEFWRDALGLELSGVEDIPDQKALVAFLPTAGSEVELVKPTSEGTGVARFLQKHGPGMHHICFEVDDLVSFLNHLKEKGVRLIDESPRTGAGGSKIAFIHPVSTNGVLVELCEPASE